VLLAGFGQNQADLPKKIGELTLYLLQQQKELQELNGGIGKCSDN
jgi:hypothetical protein